MAPNQDKKRFRPVRLLLKLAVIAAICWFGYWYGVGPLLSKQRGQPSDLYVVNDTDTSYELSLGWRRLRRTLNPGSMVHFQTYVAAAETQKLTATPRGGGAARELPVALAPDCQLLLNLEQATTYYPCLPANAADQRLGPLTALGRQLAAHRAPEALLDTRRRLREIGAGIVIDQPLKRTFIDLTRYHLYRQDLQGFNELPTSPTRARPLLTTEILDLPFGDGKMRYSPAHPEELREVSGTLGVRTRVVLPNDPIELAASQRFYLRDDGQTLNFQLVGLPATIRWEQRTYAGGWNYTATHTATGWSWQWSFDGDFLRGEMPEYHLNLVLLNGGGPQATVEKLEMMP